jgi:glycosyltransferase involved in cell wall biosynthesis
LEAASCGLPVISTRHTGIKQAVIHGKTGYLVEEHDIEGMSSYMNKVIEDRASADQLGQEGRKHILLHYETITQKEKLLHLLKSHKL